MVVARVMMMVLGRGKRRGGNHHNEQGRKQKFSHGCIVASVGVLTHTTFGEQLKNPYQGSEQQYGSIFRRAGRSMASH
jgi:hypothetical protein